MHQLQHPLLLFSLYASFFFLHQLSLVVFHNLSEYSILNSTWWSQFFLWSPVSPVYFSGLLGRFKCTNFDCYYRYLRVSQLYQLRYKYSSVFSLSFSSTLRSLRMANSTWWQILFFLYSNTSAVFGPEFGGQFVSQSYWGLYVFHFPEQILVSTYIIFKPSQVLVSFTIPWWSPSSSIHALKSFYACLLHSLLI